MKMFLFCLFILTIPLTTYSQTEKGNYTLGGSGYILPPRESRLFGINVNPQIGYFVKDNLLLGTSLSTQYIATENSKNFNYGLNLTLQYYFPFSKEKLKYFVSGRVGASGFRNNYNGIVEKTLRYGDGFSLGIMYFLNKSIGLNVSLEFVDILTRERSINYYISSGFTIFFQRKKGEE